jgi:hypothetical protein
MRFRHHRPFRQQNQRTCEARPLQFEQSAPKRAASGLRLDPYQLVPKLLRYFLRPEPSRRSKKEADMKRTAGTLAVAVVIGIVASVTSRAAPIAPAAGTQTQLNNVTQIYWYHHRWYPHRYWRRWSWRPYPYWVWGAYPSRYYWDPRLYWGRERWG